MRHFYLILILLVAGCSTTSQIQHPEARFWHLKGKLSVSFEGKSRVVSVDWLQEGDTSQIQLNGPLGSGQASVSVDPDEIWLDTGEGPRRVDPGQEMFAGDTGLALPWRDISYWVRGQTGPSGEPLPMRFEQGLWRVSILRNGPDGPELMAFEHPDIALRLRVKSLSGTI